MQFIKDLSELEALYGTPAEATTKKVTDYLTPHYRTWIERSSFCILSTSGPEGTDASPRGDAGPVVQVVDAQTLALPDWHGNNRTDSLRNLICNPQVSLMFLVAGANNVIRVNGTAQITRDAGIRAKFEHKTRQPQAVIMLTIQEVYFQCARALLRAGLWTGGDKSGGLPSPGEILVQITQGEFDGQSYDLAWPEKAKKTMW